MLINRPVRTLNTSLLLLYRQKLRKQFLFKINVRRDEITGEVWIILQVIPAPNWPVIFFIWGKLSSTFFIHSLHIWRTCNQLWGMRALPKVNTYHYYHRLKRGFNCARWLSIGGLQYWFLVHWLSFYWSLPAFLVHSPSCVHSRPILLALLCVRSVRSPHDVMIWVPRWRPPLPPVALCGCALVRNSRWNWFFFF